MTDTALVIDKCPGTVERAGESLPFVVLREGSFDSPLFLLPGLGGEPAELAALADAIDTDRAIIALEPKAHESDGSPINRIERLAELAIRTMRGIQARGPYNLGGYSFGGLVAFEIATRLRAGGHTVESLFLIEGMFDERYWPRLVWAGALLKRASWQLLRIARMRPDAAWREMRFRASRLVRRVYRRFRLNGDDITLSRGAASHPAEAMAHYRPGRYDGSLTLIAPRVDRNFGCSASTVWRGLADPIELLLVPGDHLSIVRDHASLRCVADLIAERLPQFQPGAAGLRPVPGFARPMLISTMRWFSTARVAHSLAEAGFAVTSCVPDGHPLAAVRSMAGRYRLSRLGRLRSLHKAVAEAAPDILLPDDERAIQLLGRLREHIFQSDPATAALIARSLGGTGGIASAAASRTLVMTEARRLGITCPTTQAVKDREELAAWRLPLVLKSDGSWGGRGVAVVRRADQLATAWHRLAGPPAIARALKRLLVDREIEAMRDLLLRRRASINVQAFVEGRQAIATVACREGRVVKTVCFEVVRSAEINGPATVVRMIDHPEMSRAAELIVDTFRLSGFCGLDFQIDDRDVAHLIELNARVTPTCHLLIEDRAADTVALFPQELLRDPTSGFKPDMPRNGPALTAVAMAEVRRRNRRMNRLVKTLTKQFGARLA